MKKVKRTSKFFLTKFVSLIVAEVFFCSSILPAWALSQDSLRPRSVAQNPSGRRELERASDGGEMRRRPIMVANLNMEVLDHRRLERIMRGTMARIREEGDGVRATELIFAVSHPSLDFAVGLARKLNTEFADGPQILVAAQDMYHKERGAYTGEVSAIQLKKLRVTHVLLGDADRRYGIYPEPAEKESDALLTEKLALALKYDLIPIFFVGDRQGQRSRPGGWEGALQEQLMDGFLRGIDRALQAGDVTQGKLDAAIIGYQPIWAAGRHALRAATPQEAQEAHAFIRGLLQTELRTRGLNGTKIRIIYSSSLNEKNADDLLGQPDVDGGAVHRAALHPLQLSQLVLAAERAFRTARDGGGRDVEKEEREIQSTGMALFGPLEKKWDRRPTGMKAAVQDWALYAGMKDEALGRRLREFISAYPGLRENPDALRNALQSRFTGAENPKWVRKPARLVARLSDKRIVPAVDRGIRFVASRFIVGETVEEALPRLEKLLERGIGSVLAYEVEAAKSEQEAERNKEDYIQTFRQLHRGVLEWMFLEGEGWLTQKHVAVKLSALTSSFDRDHKEEMKRRLREILRRRPPSTTVWVDMEQYRYKDLTLEIVKEILEEKEFQGGQSLGVVFQAYLRESLEDARKFVMWAEEHFDRTGARPPVRLVKGAYHEQEIAWALEEGREIPVYTDKAETDLVYEEIAELFLDHHNALEPVFGTHSIRNMTKVAAYAQAHQIPKEAFEIHMLYGMGEPIQRRLVKNGFRVRVYAPEGPIFVVAAYLNRRLVENGSQESFLLRSLGGNYPVRELLKRPELHSVRETARDGGSSRVAALKALQGRYGDDSSAIGRALLPSVVSTHRPIAEQISPNLLRSLQSP